MDWTVAAAANGEFWDRNSATHLSEWYDVEAFRKGRDSLDAIQRSELGDVTGKRLLHLQCNAGLDTLSWARLGAMVTGVDIAGGPLETARGLAAEFDLPAQFVECDLYSVPQTIDGDFDIVYTSQGVLCWLNDLHAWAEVIASMLGPNGFFYIMEEHPYAVTLDETEVKPDPGEPYFRSEEGEYDQNSKNYQWTYSLSDVVNGLISAGLQIEFLNEYDKTFYQRLPYMSKVDDEWWTIPGFSLPLMFTLGARKI